MRITNDMQHRALAFVAAANRGGHSPNDEEVTQWLEMPTPRPGRRGGVITPGRAARPERLEPWGRAYNRQLLEMLTASFAPHRQMMAELSRNAVNMINVLAPPVDRCLLPAQPEVPEVREPDSPPETFPDHLVRLRWVERDNDGGLRLTSLGRAMLRNAEIEEEALDEPVQMILGRDDPLAYPRLARRLAEADDGLLIDPYIRFEDVYRACNGTGISRILLSEKLSKEDRAAIAALVNNGAIGRPIEVRYARRTELHDRYIVCEGFVDIIGCSLNAIGVAHTTIVTPLNGSIADAARQLAEGWWDAAEVLAIWPKPTDEDSEDDVA